MATLLLRSALLLALSVALGCGTGGPQSAEELVAAYRVAHSSGDAERISRMIVWAEDVRPNVADPYEGGAPARLLTRQAILWSLNKNAADGEQTTIEAIPTPAEYRDVEITPRPLYWIHIAHRRAHTVEATTEISAASIQLPVIQWNGAQVFYGSPHFAIQTSFGRCGAKSHPQPDFEVEIPLYSNTELQLAHR